MDTFFALLRSFYVYICAIYKECKPPLFVNLLFAQAESFADSRFFIPKTQNAIFSILHIFAAILNCVD